MWVTAGIAARRGARLWPSAQRDKWGRDPGRPVEILGVGCGPSGCCCRSSRGRGPGVKAGTRASFSLAGDGETRAVEGAGLGGGRNPAGEPR